jgi:general secretion pathway protein G
MTFLKHYSRLSKIKAQRAITLIELLVIIAIIGVLSTLASSWYSGYIETARVNTAISQITALSLLIDDYILENGEPPSSLADVSNHNLSDPWGNPYEYLKLDIDTDDYAKNDIWMIGGGIMGFSMVSLNILSSSGRSKSDREDDKEDREDERESEKEDRKNDRDSDKEDSNDRDNDSSDNNSDDNRGNSNNGDNDSSDGDNGTSDNSGDSGSNGDSSNEDNADDDSSDDGSSAQTKARKDYSLVPLNTDYDLYSRGKDGQSAPPLPATVSQDDVLRANNGGFIGLASTF